MNPIAPIMTAQLFPKLDEKLIALLRTLSAQDWERATIAPLWTVKDIAAHLLDGNIRALSMLRDSYFGEKPEGIHSYQDLVDFLNRLNSDWVRAMKRLSPGVLTELLEMTGKAFSSYIQTLDPFEKATFSVAWAGEQVSDNWFHIAREYTEKWHHQQQIRLAVDQAQALYSKEFYFPHLDTSMRALPHHYRDVQAEEGESIRVRVTGESGGDWRLYCHAGKWMLVSDEVTAPTCEIQIEPDIAWRIFTKGISRQDAREKVRISGRQAWGEKIFDMLAVMA